MRASSKLHIKLIALSRLHVGSGHVSDRPHIDKPILRTLQGIPYIPATTIKGVLRTVAISIAKGCGLNVYHTVKPDKICGKCIVCNVFGAAHMKGKLLFQNAMPVSEELAKAPEKYMIFDATGITIARESGVVKEGALYTYEAVPPEATFNCIIEAYGLTLEEWQLLLASLRSVADHGLGARFSVVRVVLDEIEGEQPPETVEIKNLIEGLKG